VRGERLAHFLDRLATEVRDRGELVLRLRREVADRLDAHPLQAVVRTDAELELGVRSYNCLKRAGIQTVGELVRKSESELNAIPNFGRKSIEEVQETLRARGLSLRQD